MQVGLEPSSDFRERVKRSGQSAGAGASAPLRPHLATEAQAKDGARRIRVLIAEPSEYLADLYDQFLSKQGFEVDTASNGLDCLEKLRTFVPDLLVLEPAMPWGGGDGVLALMHEESDLPLPSVVILTRGCSPTVLYNIAPYEIADYQVKPLPARRLAERIRRIVFHRGVCQLVEDVRGEQARGDQRAVGEPV
jgi:DNA-binding response OmpR family regulator